MASLSTTLPPLTGQQPTGNGTMVSLLNTGLVQQSLAQLQVQLQQQPAPHFGSTVPGTPNQDNRTTFQEHHMQNQEARTCTPHQQESSSNGFIAMDLGESTMQVRATEDAILQGKLH
jgi:hypothetical protein